MSIKTKAQFYLYLVGKIKEYQQLKRKTKNKNFYSILEVELKNCQRDKMKLKRELDWFGVSKKQLASLI